MRTIGGKQKNSWFTGELKRLRYGAYLTQAELARRAKIPLGTYKAWECGAQLPSTNNWRRYLTFISAHCTPQDIELLKKEYINGKGA